MENIHITANVPNAFLKIALSSCITDPLTYQSKRFSVYRLQDMAAYVELHTQPSGGHSASYLTINISGGKWGF